MSNEAAPLAGVRVLDFTQNLPGPYATLILRSLGAEVIKIEPPKGDPARHLGPFFAMLNRGKQSVVFVDPAKGDFRLKSGSPAGKIGFQPFDPSAAGVRPKDRR